MKKIIDLKKISALALSLTMLLSISTYAAPVKKAVVQDLKVVASKPSNGNTNINVYTDIYVNFNQTIKSGAGINKIQILPYDRKFKFKSKVSKNILSIVPAQGYENNTKYTVIIPKNAVTNLSGKGMSADYKISFTTEGDNKSTTNGPVEELIYKTDAQAFVKFVIDEYPFLEMTKQVTGYDFEKNKDSIIADLAESKTNDEFYNKMQKVIANFLPGTHTHMGIFTVYRPTGLSFVYLNGEYVVAASKEEGIKLGDIVTKIDGKNIDDYIKTSDNVASKNIDIKRNKIYSYSGAFLTKADMTFTIKNSEGEKDYKEKLDEIKVDFQKSMGDAAIDPVNVETKILKENEIAYMTVPSFMNMNVNTVNDFIEKVQDYKYLIVDVRGNGGGYPYLATHLMTKLVSKTQSVTNYICFKNVDELNDKIKTSFNFYEDTKIMTLEEKQKLSILPDYTKNDGYTVCKVTETIKPDFTHFKGKVYILTDNNCFSACEYFPNTMKRIGGATLVGDYTGGDGILFAPDIKMFLFTEAMFRYSYTIGIQEDGVINQLNHTAPDYYVEQNKDDYIKYLTEKGDFTKYDTILNECLKLIEKYSSK